MSKKFILSSLIFIFCSCQDPNSLPSGELTGSTWYCDDPISDLYISNNIQVVIRLKFTGDKGQGTVEAFEGELGASSAKACVCNGNYILADGRKTLEISGLNNPNCPWMNKLNGSYTYSSNEKRYYFTKGTIKISHQK